MISRAGGTGKPCFSVVTVKGTIRSMGAKAVMDALARVRSHPDRKRLTTNDSAVSLPVPREDSRLVRAIGVFYFPVGAEAYGHPFRAPYCRAIASLETSEVTFERIVPADLGFAKVDVAKVLGQYESYSRRGSDFARVETEYLEGLESVIHAYEGAFALPDPAAQKKLASTFFSIVFRPMLPAYRALSPRFVEWLERPAPPAPPALPPLSRS